MVDDAGRIRDVDSASEPIANILLVDDHEENLYALEAILDDLGQNLVRAYSGQEALKHLLARDFALILLDVQMPGMDGFETAAMIRERERTKDTPIIFLTAIHRTDDYASRGYTVGAVDYLFKPIVPEILRAKVLTFIDLFKKTKKNEEQAKRLEAVNQELEVQLQEVKRLNRELESFNRELESFSYSVSHDLRAPLRSINGFSEALLEDYGDKLDEEGRDYLQRLFAGSQRMGQLIDDLLKLSRVTRISMQRTPVDLTALAWAVAGELRSLEQDRDVEFIIADDRACEADERLLTIVLQNLMGNAWKFTKHHKHATIEFGAFDQEDGQLTFFIRDDGAGFDMAYAEQLFGAFHRLHSDQEFEGTGIGLATVQRIVRRHGGQIWAEAAVERGATFYFTLC
jgi:two-component system sensor histidine kinase/response regulator